MSEIREFYEPGGSASALVVNNHVTLFGACTKIKTTERDAYPDIDDEPKEKEVKPDGAWWRNVVIGGIAAVGLAAAAVVAAPLVLTVGLAVAAVGAAGVTAYCAYHIRIIVND